MLKVFTDGGARGNPGPSAGAFAAFEMDKLLHKDHRFFGDGTNNEAEYKALIFAYEWVVKNIQNGSQRNIQFFLDSQLVVRQLMGVYRIKNINLLKFYKTIKKLEEETGAVKIEYFFIPREKNKLADKLVNTALDENSIVSRTPRL